MYEKLVEMSRNNNYTTEYLLYHFYYQKYYKLIGIDLSRQTNASTPWQFSFIRKLGDDGATMFFIAEKQRKSVLRFSLDSLTVPEWHNDGTSKKH